MTGAADDQPLAEKTPPEYRHGKRNSSQARTRDPRNRHLPIPPTAIIVQSVCHLLHALDSDVLRAKRCGPRPHPGTLCTKTAAPPGGLVTAQARKLAPVAHRAGGFVQADLSAGMCVEKSWGMVCRFQIGSLKVAFFATRRHIDHVVANQAVGH